MVVTAERLTKQRKMAVVDKAVYSLDTRNAPTFIDIVWISPMMDQVPENRRLTLIDSQCDL